MVEFTREEQARLDAWTPDQREAFCNVMQGIPVADGTEVAPGVYKGSLSGSRDAAAEPELVKGEERMPANSPLSQIESFLGMPEGSISNLLQGLLGNTSAVGTAGTSQGMPQAGRGGDDEVLAGRYENGGATQYGITRGQAKEVLTGLGYSNAQANQITDIASDIKGGDVTRAPGLHDDGRVVAPDAGKVAELGSVLANPEAAGAKAPQSNGASQMLGDALKSAGDIASGLANAAASGITGDMKAMQSNWDKAIGSAGDLVKSVSERLSFSDAKNNNPAEGFNQGLEQAAKALPDMAQGVVTTLTTGGKGR